MPLQFSGYQTRTARFQGELESPMQDVIGATLEQTFSELPINSMVRIQQLANARSTGERLTPDAATQKIKDAGLEGHLTVPHRATDASLDILIERKNKELRRQDFLSRAPTGVGSSAAQLGTALAASMLDPINVGLAFVPAVGQARYMRMLASARGVVGRTAVRAGVGAIEGAAGAAIIEPLVFAAKTQEQADYDFQDSLLNVAFGTAFGGGLHAVAGAGGDAVRRVTGKAAPWADAKPPPANSAAARIADEPLEVREAALRTATGQAMEGKAVDIEPVLTRIPDEERLIRAQVDELLAAREAQLQAMLDGPDGLAVAVRGADDTSERLAQVRRNRDTDAAYIAEDVKKQVAAEARRLALADNANAYAILQARDQGSDGAIFQKWQKRAEENVTSRRTSASDRVNKANDLIEKMQGTVDRASRVRSAEADLEQLRYGRGSARTLDELVDALPTAQQSGFRRRIEQGRTSGDVRARGAELATKAQEAAPVRTIEQDAPQAIAERRASPESDVTADVRASEAADVQLKEAPPATGDELAIQEAQLTDELAQLQEAAALAGIDLTDELAEADEFIALADTYGKAARAAVVCGINH